MALETRPLGRTGIPVTTLGFGSAPLGDLFNRLDEKTARGAVEAAVEAGVTLYDTSPFYGHGLAEHRIGAALRGVPRKSYVLSTKVGRWMDPLNQPADGNTQPPNFAGGLPHPARLDYSYDGAMRSLEQSLLRLGTDRIEIVLIHDVDVYTHGKDKVDGHFKAAMEGAYKALEKLRAEKVIDAIGVGLNEADMCERFARAGDFDAMLLAGRYSLLEQPALDSFFPLAEEKGIGMMLGGVFNSGILATGPIPGAKYNYRDAPPEILDRVAKIQKVCEAHGVTLADAALKFPLGHPAVASLVMGSVSAEETKRNRAAFDRPVPASLWTDLKAEGLLRADAPIPA
ncbi:oxidoreductase [Kaistia sp. 32K]|uniref:aldo/keto reductase n=1 Tax=Kaistia sp. 32K TaxID=2795690 RepID=UPI0019158A94|nr:aldo/keto reductase [Kaistia sp. 32K]BCP55916.1 oxidoreductase [Kaistia sp. 32K]